ncbi:MAG TPA: YbjN domain-containing protein [Spirochaetia bacterium]|nr:YbjN domain-containing protein [Spirochaetia bacterium]
MDTSKIEGYLINSSITHQEIDDNIWLINDAEKGLGNVVVLSQDSLVTIRAKVMELPKERRPELYEELLRLNADMVHGAYAIEEDHVILLDTLEYDTMDFEEFQASLDAIGLALAQHYPKLSKYR